VTNCVAGNTYRFDACGTSYDSEVTIHNAGTAIAFDASSCASDDDGQIDLISPVSGTLTFQVNLNGCASIATNSNLYITLVSSGCTDPDIPTVTASVNPICTSGSTTLNWTGSLNDATAWHVYTTNCGVTQLTTTTANSLVVTPGSTTTYYIRGEDGAGCVDESIGACGTVTVTVNALDNASFNYGAASYCVNGSDPTPTITGLGGGSFSSGAGLSINASTGTMDVSVSTPGTYTVTYATSGTCTNSSSVSVTVNALDDASFSYSASAYCADDVDPTPTITGLGGGSFSSGAGLSINASTGTMDVSVSTPGTYTVTYTTSGTCPNSSSVSLTVNALDDASFSYSVSTYCVDDIDPTPSITGLTGGSFSSGAGLSIDALTGQMDLSASTPGTYTVTYTTLGTCPNSSSVSVTVNALDDASFSYSASTYCADDVDPTPTITGLGGGSFSSGAGLSINASTGTMDVSVSTPGTYTVTYATSGTCSNSSSVSVTVNALDDASFSYSASTYCADDVDPTPSITGLTGGSFSSGAGLSINASTGTMDVSVSTPGTYTVTYATSGSCPNSSTVSVTINALDDPSFSYASSTFCLTGSNPMPTITGLAGGTFSSSAGLVINTATGEIDLATTGVGGPFTITYTTTGTCSGSSNVNVSITTAPDASFSYTGSPYCADGIATVTFGAGASAGVFTATPAGLDVNISSGDVDLSNSTAATYTVINTIAAAGGCASATANNTITVLPALVGVHNETVCFGESIIVNSVTYDAGNLTGSEVFTNVGPNNCDSTVAVTLTILPELTGNDNTTICATGSIVINGTTYDATTSTGTELFTNVGPSMCDSTVTVALNVLTALTGNDNTTICATGSVVINGTTYDATTSTGTEVFTNVGPSMCDSTVTVALNVLPALTGNDNTTICATGSVVINGTTYDATTSTGTEVFTNVGPSMCDSTVTVALNVLPALTGNDNTTICATGSVVINGTTYDATTSTGTEVFTNVGASMCDSTVTVALNVLTAIDVTITNTSPTLTANQTGATYQWLDCDNGNAVIPAATNQSYTATVNGNYAVEITVGSCVDTSACENVSTVGINEATLKVTSIYPNPTKGMFTIELSELNDNSSVTVYDMLGKVIVSKELQSRTTQIDLTGNDKGIYFINIQTNDEPIVRKVILQ
jgi:hypothetical protein